MDSPQKDPRDVDRPAQLASRSSRAGFLGKIALALAASIGGQVNMALAQPVEVAANGARYEQTRGDLEQPSKLNPREVADYFATHKKEIIDRIQAHSKDGKRTERMTLAVNAIAHNQNQEFFTLRTSPSLADSVVAQFLGGSRAIEVRPDFDPSELTDQAKLVHEVTHLLQNADDLANPAVDRTDLHNFFHHSRIHPGEGVVVPEDEQESLEAELSFINSQTDGKLEALVKTRLPLEKYQKNVKQLLKNAPSQRAVAVTNMAYYFFGNATERAQWPSYVKFIYGCKLHRSFFTPLGEEIGVPQKDHCDTLAQAANIAY